MLQRKKIKTSTGDLFALQEQQKTNTLLQMLMEKFEKRKKVEKKASKLDVTVVDDKLDIVTETKFPTIFAKKRLN